MGGGIDRLHPWPGLAVLSLHLQPHGGGSQACRQHCHMWAWAWGTVLERILNATTEQERERGLKWLLFLSQALLRSSVQSGEAERGIVASRFNCLAARRWGNLVTKWEEEGGQSSG